MERTDARFQAAVASGARADSTWPEIATMRQVPHAGDAKLYSRCCACVASGSCGWGPRPVCVIGTFLLVSEYFSCQNDARNDLRCRFRSTRAGNV